MGSGLKPELLKPLRALTKYLTSLTGLKGDYKVLSTLLMRQIPPHGFLYPSGAHRDDTEAIAVVRLRIKNIIGGEHIRSRSNEFKPRTLLEEERFARYKEHLQTKHNGQEIKEDLEKKFDYPKEPEITIYDAMPEDLSSIVFAEGVDKSGYHCINPGILENPEKEGSRLVLIVSIRKGAPEQGREKKGRQRRLSSVENGS